MVRGKKAESENYASQIEELENQTAELGNLIASREKIVDDAAKAEAENPQLKVERLQAAYEPLKAAAEKKKAVLDAKEKFVGQISSELSVTIQARNELSAEKKALLKGIGAKEEILTYKMKASRKPLEAREEMIKRGLLPVEMNLAPDENVKKTLKGEMAQAEKDLKEMRARLKDVNSQEWMAKKDIVSLRNARYYHGKRLQGIAADYEEANRKSGYAHKSVLDAESEVQKKARRERRDGIMFALRRAAVWLLVMLTALFSFTSKPSIDKTAESELNNVQKPEQIVNVAEHKAEEESRNVFRVQDGGGYWNAAKSILDRNLPGFGDLAAIEQNGMIARMSDYLQKNHERLGVTREMENPRKGEGAPWLNRGAAFTFTSQDMSAFIKSLGPGKPMNFMAVTFPGGKQFTAAASTGLAGNVMRH